MSHLEDTILEQITNADEAGLIASRIMSHFNLRGVIYTPEDVRERIDLYIEDQGPYADVSEDDREILVGEYFMYGNWDYVSERADEVGTEVIADGVAERMRELGV